MDLSHPRILALTMGDPAGIGPEIVLKAFFHRNRQGYAWLFVGDPQPLLRCARQLGLHLSIREVSQPAEAANLAMDHLAVLGVEPGLNMKSFKFGEPDPQHAATTMASIATACRLAMEHQVAAMVTPPINKNVLHQAGYAAPGHTEILGQLTATAGPVMMLAGRGLRVVPATIHQALKEVPAAITPSLLEHVLTITHEALRRDFAVSKPVLAVTGLNPHAGEKGAFGREEEEIIAPVCQKLAAEKGFHLLGPLPADSLFHAKSRKRFHAAVCMYHDQALIPLKMLAFGQAVNITLGLPIVRTSVDHGTAYDIAGTGLADHRSLLVAVEMAERIAHNRAAFQTLKKAV